MKRMTLAIIAVVVVLCIVAAIVFVSRRPGEPKTIAVGVMLPLTGDMGVIGQFAKKGIDLAADEINEAGGIAGTKIVLIYEDSKGRPSDATASIKKLATVDKVPVVIGGISSGETLAAAPIAEKEHVVLISPAASSPDITDAGEYIFRNWPSDTFDGVTMANFAYANLSIRKVAVIYSASDYGVGVKKVFVSSFQELGGKIVTEESFDEGQTDFKAQLTKIRAASPDAIYLIGNYREMAQVLRQAKEIGIKAQFLSVVTFSVPDILGLAGGAAEGVIYSGLAYDPSSDDAHVREFVARYKARYKEEPHIIAAQAYDAMRIVALAVEKGGPTGNGIRDAMSKIRDFPGVTGKTSFDEKGDVTKPAKMFTVKDGRFVPY